MRNTSSYRVAYLLASINGGMNALCNEEYEMILLRPVVERDELEVAFRERLDLEGRSGLRRGGRSVSSFLERIASFKHDWVS